MDEGEVAFEVSVTDVSRLPSDAPVLLLDCREEDEHQLVALPGALKIPMAQIPDRLEELGDPARSIVVYCHHGMRSAMVTQWLRAQGFSRAQNMAGGIDAWAVEIDPSLPRY